MKLAFAVHINYLVCNHNYNDESTRLKMSLGKDLASIRKGLGLTLEEIQGAIKIPAHTLETIETDTIFDDAEHNKTYTRSFIRSYAKALKIPDPLITDALDEVEAGLYNPGSLVERMDSKAAKPMFKPDALEEYKSEDEPAVVLKKPDIEEAPQKATPTVENVNWADLGKRFSDAEKNPALWRAAAIVGGILIVAAAIFIFRTQIFGWWSTEEPEITETQQEPVFETPLLATPDDSTQTSTTPETPAPILDPIAAPQQPQNQPTGNPLMAVYSPVLADTLTISVYAAYDKLEPIRVTSDFNWRTNPFWMEQGQAFNFSFQDTILVRGQYSRMVLLFNGHVIDNASNLYYSEDFDSIMLTRENLSDDAYLAMPPAEFPLEIGAPDSLVFPLAY